ncbi:ABC transporter ATP-binding protein [Mesorhizobium sp.]|uniref:ABC transporter ATP-binding protein n=1 Tax=Mesorhizobium sp. TaxID=1871066 RepID=UPI000FE8018D|nr:ABC transporter ATP-binding protein [Mesorhizobium sp.]RWJ31950.1 MAG: ABC transporter ATP-binding protein [Mesorhizobium sp.]TIQ73844.1 MAG: ABC transporter ATP-binding protein [Mesorhizobium sp.]
MTDRPVLSVRGLTVTLPPHMDRSHAVKDVTFDIGRNEILCIVGESGSGKSVTANAIMGLLPQTLKVTAGQIQLLEHDLLSLPGAKLRSLRGRVASIIFQDPLSALNPLMRIGDQIVEQMEAHDVGSPADRRKRAIELLHEVGLPEPQIIQYQYPFRLSGGQRQRVMIAMALSLDPDLLIADEPTTALDVTTQAQILELIRTMQRRKDMSVMFITHDFGVVSDIADRVVVMEKGNLVEKGSRDEVLHRPQHSYTRKLIAAVPRMSDANSARGADASDPILEVEHLNKTFQLTSGLFRKQRVLRAVNDVAFKVFPKSTLGVVGESGSGKSTLGKLLLKLIPADAGGRISYKGQNLASLGEAEMRPYRNRIQMVFQDPFASLNPRHTVATILTAGPRAAGIPADDASRKAAVMLERVGLSQSALRRYPHEFSEGQRQRIGIARALMFDPDVLVADEAVSALDVSIQAQILKLLQHAQTETGFAMIFITHDLRVASQMCDELIVMYRGSIVERGDAKRILNAPQHEYTTRLVGALPGAEWHRETA